MRTSLALTMAAAAAMTVPAAAAAAAPRGAIDCPLQSISAKDRAGLGASMVKDENGADAITSAHQVLAEAAKPCAKTNRWTPSQTEDAVTWAEYDLMAEELQRQSGMTASDLAIVRAYVGEDMKRLENLQRFNGQQQTQLLDELRRRGAQLRGNGGDVERQIAVVMLTREMRVQEASFAGS